jgi:uncharacterized protein YfaP (DUF2135 family)
MKAIPIRSTVLMLSAFAAFPAAAAGFDCTKAKLPVEKLICSDSELSRLDQRLAEIYARLRAQSGKDKTVLKQLADTQKSWIRERNRCADTDCLQTAYRQRLSELEAPSAGSAAASESLVIDAPLGGWRNTFGEPIEFLQRVDYPASEVNADEEASATALIKGRIQNLDVGEQKPLQLIVNGIAMPQRVENGEFERPYVFSPGSNSVEVRKAGGKSRARVQFYEAYREKLQPKIRVVLSWDTDGSDLDLHVVTPDGQHCSYSNRVLENGGALDVDVTTGYGPEIFATPAALPGTYLVYVNYYGTGSNDDLTVATVSVITNENTPDEKVHTVTIPMRHPGELVKADSFVYP